MAAWTHVIGQIWLDDWVHTTGNYPAKVRKFWAKGKPCGTEGPVRVQVLRYTGERSSGGWVIHLQGALRGWGNAQHVADWLNDRCAAWPHFCTRVVCKGEPNESRMVFGAVENSIVKIQSPKQTILWDWTATHGTY